MKWITGIWLLALGGWFVGCGPVAEIPRPISDSVKVGLLMHYAMDGNNKDLAGNNPDLQVVGATIKPSVREGKPNEVATYFNGTRANYAALPITNNIAVNGALSIAFWAKESGPGLYSPRVFELWPGNYGPGFYWFNWYQGKIKWAGPDWEIQPKQVFDRNKWYHFVVTHDVNAIRIYVNGELISKINLLGSIPPAAIKLPKFGEIGRMAQKDGDAFEGAVRDFRIYNRTISYNEVNYLYNQ
ncbi:MAG: LamG domain-containing protein [Chitinophagaceae bacterium]|jgi:hypothetical protein